MEIKRLTDTGLVQRLQALQELRSRCKREADQAMVEEARAQQAAIDKRQLLALTDELIADIINEQRSREAAAEPGEE